MFKNFLIFSLFTQLLSKASSKLQVKKFSFFNTLKTFNVWLLGGMTVMIYFNTPFKMLAGILFVFFLFNLLNSKRKD